MGACLTVYDRVDEYGRRGCVDSPFYAVPGHGSVRVRLDSRRLSRINVRGIADLSISQPKRPAIRDFGLGLTWLSKLVAAGYHQSTICIAGISAAAIAALSVGDRSVLSAFGICNSHACRPLVRRRPGSCRESVCHQYRRLHHWSTCLRVYSASYHERALGIAGPSSTLVDRRCESANVRWLRHTCGIRLAALCLLWTNGGGAGGRLHSQRGLRGSIHQPSRTT